MIGRWALVSTPTTFRNCSTVEQEVKAWTMALISIVYPDDVSADDVSADDVSWMRINVAESTRPRSWSIRNPTRTGEFNSAAREVRVIPE